MGTKTSRAAERLLSVVFQFRELWLAFVRGELETPPYLSASRLSEMLGEALDGTEPQAHSALVAHAARVVFLSEVAPSREAFRSGFRQRMRTGGATESLLNERAHAYFAGFPESEPGNVLQRVESVFEEHLDGLLRTARHARIEASKVVRAFPSRHPDIPPEAYDPVAEAERLLTVTQPLLEALHERVQGRAREPGRLAFLVSTPPDFFASEGRGRRVGEALQMWRAGLERVRIEQTRAPDLDFRSHVFVAAPRSARIRQSRGGGFLGELSLAQAAGHASAIASAHPALDPALQLPVVGSVARVSGLLALARFTDAKWLKPFSDAQRNTRLLAGGAEAFALIQGRLAAAATLAWARAPKENAYGELGELPLPASDVSATLYLRATGSELPPATAHGALLLGTRFPHILRASIASLRLRAGLRERFDEDWYRNPRVEPILQTAFQQGGRETAEELADRFGAEFEPFVEDRLDAVG